MKEEKQVILVELEQYKKKYKITNLELSKRIGTSESRITKWLRQYHKISRLSELEIRSKLQL